MSTQTLPRFVSSRQAAEALGTTRQHVAELIRLGALPAVRLGRRGRWRIPEDAIRELASRGSPP